jgi:hypothetical protein
VIRAIPASRFFRSSDGAGGEQFVSYNLTASYGFWRKPLVPAELTKDPDFTSELQGALGTVTSTLQNFYAMKDPNYTKVAAELPDLQDKLNALKTVVDTSQASHPGQLPAEFKACTKAVGGAIRRVNSAVTPNGAVPYGLVESLLSDDPDEVQLIKVNAACERDLNAMLRDPALTAATSDVDKLRRNMRTEFQKIDQTKAEASATADMAFTRRTLKTLLNEVNIHSIGPVFVFDVATIGPEKDGVGGIRYGPGGGIRFEIATIAHFTVGYAWNVKRNRGAGEGTGNIFFSIAVRDLFH